MCVGGDFIAARCYVSSKNVLGGINVRLRLNRSGICFKVLFLSITSVQSKKMKPAHLQSETYTIIIHSHP